MKTLKEYQDLLVRNKSNPSALADLSVEAGVDYAYYCEMAGEYEIKRNQFIDNEQEKDPKMSNAKAETKWGVTEEGKQDIRVRWKIKGLEKVMAGIKNATVINSISAKNQF